MTNNEIKVKAGAPIGLYKIDFSKVCGIEDVKKLLEFIDLTLSDQGDENRILPVIDMVKKIN